MIHKRWIATGSFSLALVIGLGAFGAHALHDMLAVTGRLETYHTAVEYHFYHSFALIALGLLAPYLPGKQTGIVGALFLSGIALFSGSLYTLCFTDISAFGMITPLGGVAFIAGWVWLGLGFTRQKI